MSTDGGPVDFACAKDMDSGLFSLTDSNERLGGACMARWKV